VYGAEPRQGSQPVAANPIQPSAADLPEPARPGIERNYNILVTGIGGTGVVTIGALLGMAAHLEGKGISVLDQTGLAQKNGAVTSHIRLAPSSDKLHGTNIGQGETDLVLGCDMVVAAGAGALDTYAAGRTRAVSNNHIVPLATFALNPDLPMEKGGLVDGISALVGKENASFLPATQLATALMGDAIYSNAFLMGYAWQKGLIPLSREAIERAIELNGAAVEKNMQAFLWGRLAAHDPEKAHQAAGPQSAREEFRKAEDLEEIIGIRIAQLTAYQNAGYARRYESLVRRVQEREAQRTSGKTELAHAVAHYYAKLLAYKDEYEVARLYTRPEFREQLQAQFEGDYRLKVHLAPPLLARRDPLTGRPRKMEFGPWVFKAFGLLAWLRFLRGSALDPFGHTEERKTERQLIRDYEALVEQLLDRLSPENHGLAVELASLPEQIRGFGHVKERHLAAAKQKEQELLVRFGKEHSEQAAAV
jgi:indolepyruvate ferredoxin oxidoreductase